MVMYEFPVIVEGEKLGCFLCAESVAFASIAIDVDFHGVVLSKIRCWWCQPLVRHVGLRCWPTRDQPQRKAVEPADHVIDSSVWRAIELDVVDVANQRAKDGLGFQSR